MKIMERQGVHLAATVTHAKIGIIPLDWHQGEQLTRGAAAVTSILRAAPIPPRRTAVRSRCVDVQQTVSDVYLLLTYP